MAEYKINWNRVWKIARWPLFGTALIAAFYIGSGTKGAQKPSSLEKKVMIDTTFSSQGQIGYSTEPKGKGQGYIPKGKGGQGYGQGHILPKGKGGQGQGYGQGY